MIGRVLLALFLMTIPTLAQQQLVCIPGFTEKSWAQKTGEVLIFRAVTIDHQLMRVVVNPKTLTYTVFMTGDRTCIVSVGFDYQSFKLPTPGIDS